MNNFWNGFEKRAFLHKVKVPLNTEAARQEYEKDLKSNVKRMALAMGLGTGVGYLSGPGDIPSSVLKAALVGIGANIGGNFGATHNLKRSIEKGEGEFLATKDHGGLLRRKYERLNQKA